MARNTGRGSLEMLRKCIALGFAAVLGASVGAMSDVQTLEVLNAELNRNLQHLKLEELQRPFYISYRVTDADSIYASASLGVLSQVSSSKTRRVSIEVLVGDKRVAGRGLSNQAAPLDDQDGARLRHALWLGTDSAYKSALSSLARRESDLQAQRRLSMADDFSKEESFVHFEKSTVARAGNDAVIAAAVKISEGFRGHAHVDYSLGRAGSAAYRTLFINSEGSAFVSARGESFVFGFGVASSEDGTMIDDFFAKVRPDFVEISSDEHLTEQVDHLVATLKVMREAENTVRYLGPVLFEGPAAAELLAQTFAGDLVARPPSARPMFGMESSEDLSQQIGSRIMPDFLSLADDPTLAEFEGQPLIGHYFVDMDAVPARRKVLVENGKLKALLGGRRPTEEVPNSTGNRRRYGILPSSLLLEADGGLSRRALRKRLMRQVKEEDLDYGLVVKRISNPLIRTGVLMSSENVSAVLEGKLGTTIEATRVYLDGREEPVRRASITVRSLREVIAASKERTLHEIVVSPSRRQLLADAGYAVAFVVPDLLIADVQARTPQGHVPNPYPVPHPLSQR